MEENGATLPEQGTVKLCGRALDGDMKGTVSLCGRASDGDMIWESMKSNTAAA